MVANALTRGDAVLIISRELDGVDFHTDVATGGSATTLVDSKYAASIYEDDYFNNWEIHVRTADRTTFVTDFTQSTGTWTFASGTAAASGYRYEVRDRSSWTRQQVLDAITMAYQAIPQKFLIDKIDETLAYQRHRQVYTIPSSFNHLARVYADFRTNYVARHASGTWDGVTKLRDEAARTKLAQSFQIQGGNPNKQLLDVWLLMSRVGAIGSGNVWVTIEADSSGSPSGTALATSDTVSAAGLPFEMTYQQFTFSAALPLLDKDTTYWVVVQGDYSVSSTLYLQWANDSTDSGYAYGSPKSYDGASWSAVTGDMIFTVRGTSKELVPLLSPKATQHPHWTVVREASANRLVFTEAGMALLHSCGDGAALTLEGQGPPTSPAADSTSLDVPPGYVIGSACLNLVSQNGGRYARMPGSQSRPAFWASLVEAYLRGQGSPIRKGSVQLEPY